MKHLDLFSGIGGFAIAAEEAFGDVDHIFCDNDPFSQAILRKHWPNSLIYGDIKELTAERIAADTRRKYGEPWCSEGTSRETPKRSGSAKETERYSGVDILTGGFPCQPFSAAGRRAGTEDDRHLWPEMLRVIRETNPTFILGENVGGLLTWDGGLVLEMVISDLEEAGYEAGAFVIPACALNAPHRRDRVWIAAHAIRGDAGRAPRQLPGTESEERLPERDEVGQSGEPSQVRDASDNNSIGRVNGEPEGQGVRRPEQTCSEAGECSGDDAHTLHPGLEGAKREESEGYGGQPHRSGSDQGGYWTEDWPEVAARLCTMDDGLPNGLARPRGWRNAALKGAGNAIVPQVAAEIMKAMVFNHLT